MKGVSVCAAAVSLLLLIVSLQGFGQSINASVGGTVTDPSKALIPGVGVTATNTGTGIVNSTVTNESGAYQFPALQPGTYKLSAELPGFQTQTFTDVQLGGAQQVTLNFTMQVAAAAGQKVEVTVAADTLLATTSNSIGTVLPEYRVRDLPALTGNTFNIVSNLPGVQRDGTGTFGYMAGGRLGDVNSTRDGINVNDGRYENGAWSTVFSPSDMVEEVKVIVAPVDAETSRGSGQVQMITRSGTNQFRGSVYWSNHNSALDANDWFNNQKGLGKSYDNRNQYGARVGGPIIKDKLFFFADGERMKQDGLLPLVIPAPFQALTGGFLSPFRDSAITGKLDWQATKDVHAFYRFTYNWNKSEANFGYAYQVYSNRDNTPSHAAGVDWNKGSWSHSFRFGYLKFHNLIGDATQGASFFNPIPNAEILVADLGDLQLSGPNLLAPQQTFQTNKQIKYDGSKVYGSHILRFGIGFNDINGGGFASFFGIAPLDVTVSSGCAVPGQITTCPLLQGVLGNGQGFFTEKPAFGYPGGGQHDARFQFYLGDSWKLKPNFTLTYGLRYNRDTGRSDSDLSSIPCSVVAAGPLAADAPCSGNTPLLDQFGPGLGNRVNQPNTQFGPQVGIAWDPTKKGKTVIRAGAGIYYENSIFNNTLFDRPAKLAKGLFFQEAVLGCNGPGATTFNIPGKGNVTSINGVDLGSGVCGQPLSVAGPLLFDLQQEFQAAVKAQGPTANPSFIGNTLMVSNSIQGLAAFDPNFRNARSYQFNVGMQHEIWKGGVLTADYIRNVSTHFMLTIDENHVGDARFLDVNAANTAIATTLAACGATTIDGAIASGTCPGPNGTTHTANINDFAGNGLDSGNVFGGGPANLSGAAFGGINRNVGVGAFEIPEGRSTYNALQMSYKQQLANPMPGFSSMNLTVAYTLSRFVGDGASDQFFSATARDNNNPSYFTGPTSLDRTDAFKFGLTMEVAHRGPRLSVIGNFGTAHPTTLNLLAANGGLSNGINSTAEIFHSDLTGDGSVQDIFPTDPGQAAGKPGQFMRSVSPTQLTNVINSWNSTTAGTLTPAGQSLVATGLFTTAQLQALQAYKPFLAPPPSDAVGNGIFREVSTTLAWPIKLTERFNIEPSFSAFNVFNLANFGTEFGAMPYSLTPFAPGSVGSAGSVNGTASGTTRESLRTGTGSGIFSLGAPRQVEWGVRLNF